MHFTRPIHNYVESWGSHTLLGTVVQLHSQIVIMSVYTCLTFYCCNSTHTLLGPVAIRRTTWLYLHTLMVHTQFLDQFYSCTFLLKFSLFSLLDRLHNCTVYLYTRLCQPGLWYFTSELVYWWANSGMSSPNSSSIPKQSEPFQPITGHLQFFCFTVIGSFRSIQPLPP